jgi:predicted amidohydrolase YtcJ
VDYRPFEALGVLHSEPLAAGETKEAIDALTREAAWASFDDHRKGSLVRDMLADVVVFSTDIMSQPAAELDDAEVSVTIFDGKVVYRRSAETDR